MTARFRIEVLHGVNLNLLGERDPLHYGTLTLADLDAQIAAWATELGLQASFFQTNAESEYVERLHALRGQVDGVILNPGSWTHYAYSIHDALELTGLHGGRGAPLRCPGARALAAAVGDRRSLPRDILRHGPRGLPARARASARGAAEAGT